MGEHSHTTQLVAWSLLYSIKLVPHGEKWMTHNIGKEIPASAQHLPLWGEGMFSDWRLMAWHFQGNHRRGNYWGVNTVLNGLAEFFEEKTWWSPILTTLLELFNKSKYRSLLSSFHWSHTHAQNMNNWHCLGANCQYLKPFLLSFT